MKNKISFVRLTQIEPRLLVDHMSDQRVAEHMPLLDFEWTDDVAIEFIATKEERWRTDGLGHWAILADGKYAGWGGFQLEGKDWDFGLVLKPVFFGLGYRISMKAIRFAFADKRIPYITFLLPPSRQSLGALKRLGAEFVGEIVYENEAFKKYRLKTQ